MTEEQKQKTAAISLQEIVAIYKINGLNFFALSEKERDVVFQVFQSGTSFISNHGKEILNG